jgi:hypothetical protein
VAFLRPPLEAVATEGRQFCDAPLHQTAPRIGLTIRSPAKSFSLSVTSTHSFAPATAAMIMSSALRGRPADRGATETYITAEKLRVVADAAREPAVLVSPKPDRRLVNLVRLLARQAARDFVQTETDSQRRDRLSE